MDRLLFIDDDPTELEDFGKIVERKYTYIPIHWPEDAAKLNTDLSPDVIVSDLYLPSISGDTRPTQAEQVEAAKAAQQVSGMFSQLYADFPADEKARLRRTMQAVSSAYDLLRLQWSALGQSPSHGVELLARMRGRYPHVPFIFYSRKITPEDVIRVLGAGADDAIRKGAFKDDSVLGRISAVLTSRTASVDATDQKSELKGGAFQQPLSPASVARRMTAWAESANSWVSFGAKLVALGTAVVSFLLARSKFLDWLHQDRAMSKAGAQTSSTLDSVAVVLGWYLLVWLLLLSGDVFGRIFAELWKGIILAVLHIFQRGVKDSAFTGTLQEYPPKLFRIAWEVCVIILAVVPALRFAIRLLVR